MTKISEIKWNWGTKLALWIIAFILFILTLVYLSLGYDVNLVEKDYYPKGLIYQERIDAIKNARNAGSDIGFEQYDQQIVVSLTNCIADSGTVYFFRPSTTDEDIIVDIIDIINKPALPLSEFITGKYLVKVNWWHKNNEYYLEKALIIK